MPIDVTLPGGLTLALVPDLILIAGAMVLMLWRRGGRTARTISDPSVLEHSCSPS